MSLRFGLLVPIALLLVAGPEVPGKEASLSGEVVYHQSFDRGSDQWRMGKNKSHTEGETWHRNIFGFFGEGVDLSWSPTGGRSGGFAYSESPWYFDDNHGEFSWLYLIANRRTEGTTVVGRDLRNATVRVSLRGRDLDLKGAKLYFWLQGPAPHIRDQSPADLRRLSPTSQYAAEVYRCWALNSVPLEGYLTDGRWHDVTFQIDPDERKWGFMGLINGGLRRKIRVIQSLTSAEGTLPYILGDGKLYNFGFNLYEIDPLDPPAGKIDIDEFSMTLAPSNPPLPDPR